MQELKNILDEVLNIDLLNLTISGPRNKDGVLRIKIRPILVKDQLCFQASKEEQKKVFHKNYTGAAMKKEILEQMDGNFTQLQAATESMQVTVLVSKKGKMTVKRKKKAESKDAPAKQQNFNANAPFGLDAKRREQLSHNRRKKYLLPEDVKVPFLVDLGVQTKDGMIVRTRYDKFRQINRFLEFIDDVIPALPSDREITIIDFGCGKSYLTFAMYYYLHEQKRLDVRIIGLDLKEDVIQHCSRLAVKYGYDKLTFQTGDIADYEGSSRADMVVTLHACDTATDYALAKAVGWNASVILSVPCCQHEANRQIENDLLKPALKYGIIKERMAALLTDATRANLLEQQGYQVQLLEFIDMEHTPKNILIRAVKSGEGKANPAYEAMRDGLNLELTLNRLLDGDK